MTKKKKKREETYRLSLKGLLFLVEPEMSERIYADIEAHCYRTGTNAVVIKDSGVFVTVEEQK